MPSRRPAPSARIEPDAKDWTWVLARPCPDCGFDATKVARRGLPGGIRADAAGWAAVLALPDVRQRPDAATWSPLEYACHVRDVNRVMGVRLALLLDVDTPTFANWDQDATALDDDYGSQDPSAVGRELIEAADGVAQQYADLIDADEATWSRRGLRSNGSEFTVETLSRYYLHDLVHHAHDVQAWATRATVAAYDASAGSYATAAAELTEPTRVRLARFAAAVQAAGSPVDGRDALVLEVGSGGGRDAAALEALGLRVRRTDVSPGFVAALRATGVDADLLDPLFDDLGGPYDGVWANACLLHVARSDLPRVLARLAAATRSGGVLGFSLKQGDGQRWSTHGSVTAPRRFVYWRETPLRSALVAAGWVVDHLDVEVSAVGGETWLLGLARRG